MLGLMFQTLNQLSESDLADHMANLDFDMVGSPT